MPGYSDQSFWAKLTRFAKHAGAKVVERALQLYYTAQEPGTPTWAKSVIYGALAYFIFPVDAIPDVIPVAGFTDDLGVLAAAAACVALYLTPEVRRKAKQKMREWFESEN